jgi:hypothetical protein
MYSIHSINNLWWVRFVLQLDDFILGSGWCQIINVDILLFVTSVSAKTKDTNKQNALQQFPCQFATPLIFSPNNMRLSSASHSSRFSYKWGWIRRAFAPSAETPDLVQVLTQTRCPWKISCFFLGLKRNNLTKNSRHSCRVDVQECEPPRSMP